MASPLLSNRLFLTLVPALVATAAIAYPLLKAGMPLTSGPRKHSLADLPADVKSQVDEVYPEDIFPGGAYVDLPIGRVRYWIFGPETGRKVVFIHGLSVPSFIWKDVAPKFAEAGHRVMLFDLYGRGYSDAPVSLYNISLYTTQLALLMQHVHWDKASVVGLSMGGPIAAAFTTQFPQLVDDKVVLLAPAGLFGSEILPRGLNLLTSSLFLPIVNGGIVRGSARRQLKRPSEPIDRIVQLQRAYLPYFNAVLLLSMRYGPLRGQTDHYKSHAFNGRTVLILHGTKDSVVPPRFAREIQALFPEGAKCEVVDIQDADHDFTISHPEDVLVELKRFFA
ncbi:alpha/beta-hydrolase [Hymenopellis radicata]|nr:alpha/beta-hydrolase [Hymenopellis radicata]